jgi:hypothetical protein
MFLMFHLLRVITAEMDKVLTEAHIELEAAAVLVQRVILLTQYPVLQVAEALVKHQLLQDHPV